MLKADIYHDEIMSLCANINSMQLNNRDDVESFVRDFTKLTYDYCMFGLLYDYYIENIEVLRENALRLHGINALIVDRQALMAAFPDLKSHIEHVIVSPDGSGGWRVFRRMYLSGTNTGPSQYGPATGQVLGDRNLNLSMFYISQIEGKWRITYEMDMRRVFLKTT